MVIITARTPAAPAQPLSEAPMSLHAPEARPRIEPQQLDTLDPAVHARTVVALHGAGRHRAPEPVSPNCSLWWTREVGRFDIDVVCTLPAGHKQNLHDARDGSGYSHGYLIDERLVA